MKRLPCTMGFTLIELMIVVGLIAIVATLAYPSYVDSIRKGRRGDAQQGLMEAALKLESFYARNATYTADLTQIGYPNVGWNDIDVAAGSGIVYYQFRVNPAPIPVGSCDDLANCFELETQSLLDQVNDPVARYTLRSTGAKTHTISGASTVGWR